MSALRAKFEEAQRLAAEKAAAVQPVIVVPEGGEAVGSIVFESLDDLLSGELPPPDVLVDDILYAEGVHLASGHPASGKSVLASLLVASDLHSNGLVLPGLEGLSGAISWWDPNQARTFFLYGGYWMAKYESPKGLRSNPLFGHSSNHHGSGTAGFTSGEV